MGYLQKYTTDQKRKIDPYPYEQIIQRQPTCSSHETKRQALTSSNIHETLCCFSLSTAPGLPFLAAAQRLHAPMERAETIHTLFGRHTAHINENHRNAHGDNES